MRASAMLLPTLLVLFTAPDPLFAGAAAAQTVSENPADPKRNASYDVRRLQRLLKLLAARNPQRFASADPGVIDGILGKGTVTAIRNFQRTIGVPENPKVTKVLFAQILTADAEPLLPAPGPDAYREMTATPSTAAKPEHSVAKANAANPRVRYAQLGSVKDRERVNAEWKRLARTIPALGSHQPVIEVANLGPRGTYYRILVGPFEDFRQASDFCGELRKRRQSCLVKKATVTESIDSEKPAKLATQAPPKPDPADSTRVVPDKETTAPGKETASPPNTQPAPPAEEPHSQVEITVPDTSAPQQLELTPVEESLADPVPPPDSAPAIATTSTDGASEPLESAAAVKRAQSEDLARSDIAPNPFGAAAEKMDKAVSRDQTRQPVVAPTTAIAQWLGRADRYTVQSYLGPTIAAAAGTIFGLLVLVWRQRQRRGLVFDEILVTPWFEEMDRDEPGRAEPLSRTETEPKDLLEELRSQFDAEDLVESRRTRDGFLSEIAELKDVSATGYNGEHAMLVNRKLNQLISSDPATYKAIFLSWIFLNHVADRISSSDYSMKRLDPRIQAEFRLLASLFKIHLLELEARHHVRQRLPNVFAALHDL